MLNIFMVRLNFFSGKWNGMSEESIEKITESGSTFAPTFVDHHLLADNF